MFFRDIGIFDHGHDGDVDIESVQDADDANKEGSEDDGMSNWAAGHDEDKLFDTENSVLCEWPTMEEKGVLLKIEQVTGEQ